MQTTMLRSKAVAVRSTRARVVRCEAGLRQFQLAGAAAMAAAALIVAPADAGVVLAQPALKKAFQEDGSVAASTSAPAAKGAAKAKAAPAPKKEASSSEEFLDPRSIALPGSVLFVGGLAFAASKVDSEFDDFISGAFLKPSDEIGAGYESAIKASAGGIYGPPEGTAKKVAAKKKGKK